MPVCSFAHCETALSLQAAYSDYQIGAFENFHQPVEETLIILRPGPKVFFEYELRFINCLESQLLIGHLCLPIKKLRLVNRTINQAAFEKCSRSSNQFLFQREPERTIAAGGSRQRVHGGNLQRLAERWALMTATIRSEGVPGGKNPRYRPSRSIR